MKTILINSITCILFALLFGCSSARISPAQMSTVSDSALNSNEPDPLGGTSTPGVEGAPTYSFTGGGGL